MSALYTTQARVVGGRAGHAETSDGLLKVDLAMPKELGGQGGATNPEQLFAAGYGACFESAIRFVARKQKLPLQDAAVTATVSLYPNDQGGFRLGVALAAETKGLDQYPRRTRSAPIPTPSGAISMWCFPRWRLRQRRHDD